MSTKKQAAAAAAKKAGAAAPKAGPVDVAPIIAKATEKVPPKIRPMFDKVVLSGMRIMFDKSSHSMMLEALDKPGPLAKRMSDGMIQLMYLMWKQSNHTIPPQLIVPAAVVLTLKVFQFLQESKEPEATAQVLGDAMEQTVQGILDRFGATEDKLPELLKGEDPGASIVKDMGLKAAPGAAPGAPQGGGMLDSAMEG